MYSDFFEFFVIGQRISMVGVPARTGERQQEYVKLMGVLAERVLKERLAKLEGADWDSASSSDEDNVQVVEPKLSDKKQPEKPKTKTQKVIKKTESSVIYLGRIPHGFYEEQMQGFFSQFGQVKQLRLSRNKKSGESKHFGFIEFEDPKVAQIVAQTMQGYRLFDHTLQCHVLPPDKIHPNLFVGANKEFRKLPWKKLAREAHNRPRSLEQQQKLLQKLLKKEAATRKRLSSMGIEYDFGGYQKACIQPTSKHVKF